MRAYPDRKKMLRGRILTGLALLPLTATIAVADSAGGAASGGMSPLTLIFIGLLAAIVLLQLVPALVLFGSIIVAVFKRSAKKGVEAGSEQA